MKWRRFSPGWAIPGVLLLFTLFFYWRILFTNRLMFPWDAADFFYPYFHFVHEELRHLRLPLWDPYVMSGFPIIGDLEAQIFYPINWLFVLVNPFSPLPYKLVEAQLILHFFLAGLFLYFLAREFVSTATPALLGGVLFMTSGAMVAHTQHLASINTMAWYPLIFLLARRGLLHGDYYYTASAGVLYGIQILAGHWQHSVYLGVLLFLYFSYEAIVGPLRRVLWPRWILMLTAVAGIGAGLAMVQIVPSYELGNLSVRNQITDLYITLGNDPRYLLTLILPNYLGGLHGIEKWGPSDLSFLYTFLTVPGFLLALLGLGETVRRRNYFWLGMILLCIDLSLGESGHLARALVWIPILNQFRTAATFFDLANFGLCLMAAVGAATLFSEEFSRQWKSRLAAGLAILLLSATLLGVVWQLPWTIPSWSHMLASLAVVSLIVTGMMRNRIQPGVAQWAFFGLMVFDLCFYSMNQPISTVVEDPRTYLARDWAAHRTEMVQFLRSDGANDFRVAGIAESMWSGNGWNVWRIPGIYGWNPLTLERYERYIQTFTQTSDYTLPYGGPDHNFDSPLFDLLGTKFLLIADADMEEKLKLRESPRFRHVYSLSGWWQLYQNLEYIPHGWFYPRAAAVPNLDAALAVMNSRWFNTRRTLVFEREDLRGDGAGLVEELPVIHLTPEEVAAASKGRAREDPECYERRVMFAGNWGASGDWVRFDVTGPTTPGRYLVLLQYTAGYRPTPVLRAEVSQAGETQSPGPVRLPGTYNWLCSKARTADLGEFELRPGDLQLTLHSEADSLTNVYAVWLVRLPPAVPPEPAPFSFENFSAAANRISLEVRARQDGFLLLNEVYYPGWEATLDGKATEILRANTIFRTLYVPAGAHRIEMRFRPRYFAWGAAVSLTTLAAFAVCTLLRRRRRSAVNSAATVPRPLS